MTSPLILALDTDDLDIAKSWIDCTREAIGVYKIGLEFFLKFGREGIASLREAGDFELFLDLKLHDIPNTVAGATASIRGIAPKFLTVHASGGRKMISAAAEVAPEISITAVTILTSLSEADLHDVGFSGNNVESAVRLAQLAVESGARSIVCSPLEVAAIRGHVRPEIELITPGVRPADSAADDQMRTMTPRQAMNAGANFLVIGRPITSHWLTSASAMREAALRILEPLTA
jgi:orotidine-5'-phosphate decarboxylase